MKSRIAIILIAAASLLAASCEGPMGPRGPQGPMGPEGPAGAVTSVANITLHVKANQWEYSGIPNNNYFVATFEMPEITADVFNGGAVIMYRIFNYGTMDVTQMAMPFQRQVELPVKDEGGNISWYFYEEDLDYEIQPGVLRIYYTRNDFDYELDETFVPEPMDFRCVVMY